MKKYTEMSADELKDQKSALAIEYEKMKASGLKLDMSRGKPDANQLGISRGILDAVDSKTLTVTESGIECANYAPLDGIPEAKRLMAGLLMTEEDEVFVGGNSSLNLMHDVITFCLMFCLPGCEKPWIKQGEVKFICPVPGYDRHFAVTEHLGFTMLPVPMKSDGPDLDAAEELVKDPSVKGMWCVPKYSNPQGITCSDGVIKRFAAMKPAACDFRFFFDNAYAVHDLYDDKKDELMPILAEFKKQGRENNAFIFSSTSKITFPGGGVSAIGAAKENMDFIKKHMSKMTIGYDKINQLRHARYFKDMNGIKQHMKKHAAAMRPKFDTVINTFQSELSDTGIVSWNKPLGGYFISFDAMPGTAKRAVAMCKAAGLTITAAGATHPYGNDPEDKTIRIAPSLPGVEELEKAVKLFCVAVKLAAVEKLLGNK